MAPKKDKTIIFQINPFSLRNFTSYFNFIVLMTTIVFVIISLCYAYGYTPKFEAMGLLKSQPYAQINDLSSNSLTARRDTPPQTMQEMDLINTHHLFRKVVDDTHANIKSYHSLWSLWDSLRSILSEDAHWQRFLDTGINHNWSKTGQPIVWEAVSIPPLLFGKDISLRYVDKTHYQVLLDDLSLDCEIKKPCLAPKLGALWIIKHIYAKPYQRLYLTIENPDKAAEELRSRVKIIIPNIDNKQGDQRSPLMQNLIEISLVDKNPIFASSVVNSILDAAVYFSAQRKKQESEQAAHLLRQQQQLIYTRLAIANSELALLKKQHQPLSAESEADYLYKRLGFVQETLIALQQKEQDFMLRMTSDNAQLKNIREEIHILSEKEQTIHRIIAQTPIEAKRITLLEGEVNAQLDLLKVTVAQQQLLASLSKTHFSDLQIVDSASIPMTPIDYARWELVMMFAIIGLILGYIIATAIV